MNLLLDTHGFLWALFTPGKLSKAAFSEINPNVAKVEDAVYPRHAP